MASFARTCAFSLVCTSALVAACGHLPFDEVPFDSPEREAGAPPDGPVAPPERDGAAFDAGRRGRDAALDATVEADATLDASCGPACEDGIFVSNVGLDTNLGTATAPVRTIQHGITLAAAAGKHDVFVAAGHYSEKVTLLDAINVRGGYVCSAAAACSWTRDLEGTDTLIANTDFEGVLATKTVTQKTLFEGFHVVGLGGSVPATAPSGSVAMTLLGGTPKVKRCRIVGGDTSTAGLGPRRSVGVAVIAPSNAEGAVLDQNVIASGVGVDASIGITFESRTGLVDVAIASVTRNDIQSGPAGFSTGVLASASASPSVLHGNVIVAGGAIAPGTTITANSLWGISVSSEMAIDGNRINLDQARVGSCGGNTSYCGGIQSQSSKTVITNNLIFGVKGPKSCGVLLGDGEQRPPRAVVLNGNTVDGVGTSNDATFSAAIVVRLLNVAAAEMGNVRNNILLPGTAASRYGIYEDNTPSRQAHLTAFDNNDVFTKDGMNGGKAVVFHSSDGTTTNDRDINQLTGTIPVANGNIDMLPHFSDALFHIDPKSSPCVDKGFPSNENPPVDIDGDKRPGGTAMDIGADEAELISNVTRERDTLAELAWSVVVTPAVDAPEALEVLTDALIERGILRAATRVEMRQRAWAWATRATARPVPVPAGSTEAIVQEALERALRGEHVLILVASHREAARVDGLARQRFLDRAQAESFREEPLEVWRRIHVETPRATARIRGFPFAATFDLTGG